MRKCFEQNSLWNDDSRDRSLLMWSKINTINFQPRKYSHFQVCASFVVIVFFSVHIFHFSKGHCDALSAFIGGTGNSYEVRIGKLSPDKLRHKLWPNTGHNNIAFGTKPLLPVAAGALYVTMCHQRSQHFHSAHAAMSKQLIWIATYQWSRYAAHVWHLE